ncbi:MAG TPA: hypothetical protein V6D22_13805 [Candidatus Obscuribacterales bacterium]
MNRTAKQIITFAVNWVLAEGRGHTIVRSVWDPSALTCASCKRPVLPVCPYTIPENVASVST